MCFAAESAEHRWTGAQYKVCDLWEAGEWSVQAKTRKKWPQFRLISLFLFHFSTFQLCWKTTIILKLREKSASAFVCSAQIIFNLPNLDEKGFWHICSRVKAVDLFTAVSHLLQERCCSPTTKTWHDCYSKGHGLWTPGIILSILLEY